MPSVTVWFSWNGLPMASTHSATRSFAESPHGITGRPVAFTLSSAMSVQGSVPTTRARSSRLSARPIGDLGAVVADDVVVGQHVPVARHHHAGPERHVADLPAAERLGLVAEEVAEERVVEERAVRRPDRLRRRDLRHRADRLARDAGEIGEPGDGPAGGPGLLSRLACLAGGVCGRDHGGVARLRRVQAPGEDQSRAESDGNSQR